MVMEKENDEKEKRWIKKRRRREKRSGTKVRETGRYFTQFDRLTTSE